MYYEKSEVRVIQVICFRISSTFFFGSVQDKIGLNVSLSVEIFSYPALKNNTDAEKTSTSMEVVLK